MVENKKTKLVPGEWIKIGGTKSSSRFHSRYIIERLKERQQHQEKLNILAEVAFKELMK